MCKFICIVLGFAALVAVASPVSGGPPPTTAAGWMYFAENQTSLIRRAHLDGSNVETLFSAADGVIGPWGVALDVDAGKIYWTQGIGTSHRVRRGNMDGTGTVQTLVTHFLPMHEIALDLEGGRVYWSTVIAPDGLILSANLADGSDVQTWQTVFAPTGALSFDAAARKLYWGMVPELSCSGGKIQRADIDNPRGIEDVVTGLKRVQSIHVDSTSSAIYWSEMCTNMIRSTDLSAVKLPVDGGDADTLVPDEYTAGLALDAGTGKLYWTHPIDPDSIRRANAADGTAIELLIDLGPVGPQGIALDPGNPADLNGDGTVNGIDLAILLGAWGPCPKRGTCAADLNHDGIVNGFDLAMLLGSWGS